MSRRLAIAVAVVLCLSFLPLSGLVGIGSVVAQETGDDTDGPDPTHEHPDEAEGEGDVDRVIGWLQDRLSGSPEESTAHLDEGEYEQAHEMIGDEHSEYLSLYDDMADDTDRGDGEQVEEYERAREEQVALIDGVEEYETTHEEYQEAREAGDDERARELARELKDLEREIDERSAAVQQHHRSIEEDTGTDTSSTRESVERVRSTVATTQEEVRDAEFVRTELSVSADSSTAAFADPMTIEGTITTAAGEPVADEQIVLEIGERTVSTMTDSTGSFDVEYRPMTEPLDTTEIDVRYTPETQSVYASAETTLSVAIEGTEPDVAIVEATDDIGFGEEFTVEGEVEADGVGVDGVPVVVFADGERLDEVETDEDGTFTLTTPLPATVSAGEVDIRAQVALEERAIEPAVAVGSVGVVETPGSIDLTAEHRDDSIHVYGTLVTEEGAPVGGEPIELVVDGEAVGTVETGEDGTYETLLALPDDADALVSTEAVYAEDGSNVGDATATADLRVGESSVIARIGEDLGIDTVTVSSLDAPHWLGIGGLLGIVGLAAYYLLSRRGRSDDSARGSTAMSNSQGTDEVSTGSPTDLQTTLFDTAHERLQAGDAERAVERAYIAMRQGFDVDGRSRTETHWEFYRGYLDELSTERADALRSLTERFERAAFSTFGVSIDDARQAIEEAETVADGRGETP